MMERGSCRFGTAAGGLRFGIHSLSALLFALSIVLTPAPASGHGYVNSPRARNIVAFRDGLDWTSDPNLRQTTPKKDYDPMSLNRGGLCGVSPTPLSSTHNINYVFPPNYNGDLMAENIQATYAQDSIVEFELVLTAHHYGHVEYKACPLAEHGDAPTQDCFDAHPLTLVEDVSGGLPIDTNYPGRAYLLPPGEMAMGGSPQGHIMRHRYQLPPGLNGNLVLIQWHYVTGNTCFDVGYDDYYANHYPYTMGNLNDCPQPLDECGEVGGGRPEQFWNCVEVKIDPASGDSPSPVPPSGSGSLGCPAEFVGGGPPPSPYPPTTPPPPPPPAPTPSGPSASTVRCGLSFDDANNKCGDTCGANGHLCAAPEGCFQGLAVDACPDPTSPPTDAPVQSPVAVPTPISSTDAPTGSPVAAPTDPPGPTSPTPSPPEDREGDSRMIAYLGNWQACPSPNQYAQYTHIIIAFAVSYTWSPSKNNCDTQCNIGSPVPICNNQNNQALVDLWRSQGKKVILSFGGAGMGGSWDSDNNDCWEYCFGKEDHVVSQLDTIVRAQNFDGVDLDYEYFYDDGDPFSLASSTGAEARYFIDKVTRDLKTTLPPGQNLITHAPMEPDSAKGTAYYGILKANAANLDFLMPQYYNGDSRPALDGLAGATHGSKAALDHYNDLVNDMFGGDATKVVFGFCISDCSGTNSNANAAQASAVMTELNGYYSCNGGAFFWVVNHDYGGSWSATVGDAAGVGENNCGPWDPTTSPAPTPSPPPPTVAPPTNPTNCPGESNHCGPGNPCADGSCCSEWGYCGITSEFCGECCQSNCWTVPTPAPPPPTPKPTPKPTYFTQPPTVTMTPTNTPPEEVTDSRLIAYVGNWQPCPTPEQYEHYTHIIIAFAVSYTWQPGKNNCDTQCNIGAPVPICNNENNQPLVDLWRSQGKKVILSFGGAGMGGSWDGNNDCWEYCYGKEDHVVSQLDTIVRAQNFDGVDIDFEYFYDTTGAQYFLNKVTQDLKATLPAGQNIITHAPMEPDAAMGTSYYNLLKANAHLLDFLMPQYYNGHTYPANGIGPTMPHYNDLVDDMFGGDPNKVVWGFCIADCGGFNANAGQASNVMTTLKDYYQCNGGAFFWVADHDTNGMWSGPVSDAIGQCGPPTVSPAPTNSPAPTVTTYVANNHARCGKSEVDARETCGTPCSHSTDCSDGDGCYGVHYNYCDDPNFEPINYVNPELSSVVMRCGVDETESRSFCQAPCSSASDCEFGQGCHVNQPNYCGSPVAPPPGPGPTQSPVVSPTESPTESSTESPTESPTESSTESPTSLPTDGPTPPPTDGPVATDAPTDGPVATDAPTDGPTDSPVATDAPTAGTSSPTKSPTDAPTAPPPTPVPGPPPPLVAGTQPRCGTSEAAARELCGAECSTSADCPAGTWCWGMHPNYCSDPNFTPFGYTVPATVSQVYYRCGKSEVEARSLCQKPCLYSSDCDSGDTCIAVNQNYCGSATSGRRLGLRGGI